MIYHEALQDQASIAALLTATREAIADGNNINSIVKLLGLTHPATRTTITESNRDSAMLLVIMSELSNLRSEIRSVGSPPDRGYGFRHLRRIVQDGPVELASLVDEFNRLEFNVDNLVVGGIPPTDFTYELESLDSRLKVLIVQVDMPKRDGEIALSMRNKLLKLRRCHDEFMRSAKAELDS